MGIFFNLDEKEQAFARKDYVFCVVIYDIISNKRRLKLSQILESYGVRVQRSCFEIILDTPTYKKLMIDLNDFYSEKEQDNIILYKGKASDIVKFNDYLGAEQEEALIFL